MRCLCRCPGQEPQHRGGRRHLMGDTHEGERDRRARHVATAFAVTAHVRATYGTFPRSRAHTKTLKTVRAQSARQTDDWFEDRPPDPHESRRSYTPLHATRISLINRHTSNTSFDKCGCHRAHMRQETTGTHHARCTRATALRPRSVVRQAPPEPLHSRVSHSSPLSTLAFHSQ